MMQDKKQPIYIDVRELFNPKLFELLNPPAEDEIKYPDEKLAISSTKELAEALNIPRNQASALLRSEGFPKIMISEKRFLIPRAALNEWLRQQAVEGTR